MVNGASDRKGTRTGFRLPGAIVWAALFALAASPLGAFDLASAQRFQLDNGLTVIVLEVPTAPAVSVQALYRVGARNEEVGQTGVTHFLEHMAFRASAHFPDTDLVSSIYAVGGEWHGYTWLDQTTYFETLPADQLDLALKIEADRMAWLQIPAADVEAERGAVLAEMHGYENDPATVLHDAVLAVAFLQHPYRNNTIGWESDVEKISHGDLVEFYRRAYCPANAVLAVVGPVSASGVLEQVRELFGDLPGGERTQPPPTVEPPQTGVRRVELLGAAGRETLQDRLPRAVRHRSRLPRLPARATGAGGRSRRQLRAERVRGCGAADIAAGRYHERPRDLVSAAGRALRIHASRAASMATPQRPISRGGCRPRSTP